MGHLLLDREFASGAGSRVEPEWFGAETGLVKTRQLQVKFRSEFGRLPTIDEVREGPGMRSEEPAIRQLVADTIVAAKQAAVRFPADALSEEIRHWHKGLLYRAGVYRSAELYRGGRADEAFAEMERMIERLREADRDKDHRHRWGNFRQMLAAREAEYSDALTLGNPLLDKRLMPESDSGSLIRGQTTIILSGTNRGKSRFLTTVVKENFLRRKRILWITHEDPEVDVSMNMWCSVLRLNRAEVMKLWKDPQGAALMDRLSEQLEELVEFAFMPPTGLAVEDVVDSIRRRQAESIATTGQGFDLLVDDYPKKLTARKAQGDFRHVLTYVYEQFVGLALEYGMHALLAYQTNREGHAASMAGTNPIFVYIDGGVEDAIKNPEILRGIERVQQQLQLDPQIGKTVSIVDFIKRMNQAMNSDRKEFYRVPESSELVAQYLLLYSNSGEPGDFDSYVDYGYQRALITAFARTDSSAYIDRLAKSIQAFANQQFPQKFEVRVGGGATGGVALNEVMIREKILNILQIMGAVLLISSLVFRSALAGFLILVPLVAAVFANFGVMGLLGIPLQIATSLVSAMAVGIGADYSIYMSYRLREELRQGASESVAVEKAFKSAGKATLFVSSAVAGGFGVLMFSYGFMIHIWMGFLITIAMLVSSIATLTLFPALILDLRPKFIFAKGALR
jgi:hypothetical protein